MKESKKNLMAFNGGGSACINSNTLISYKDITKSMYCYNGTTSNDTGALTYSTTNISEEAISNYAKIGNGYTRITLIEN